MKFKNIAVPFCGEEESKTVHAALVAGGCTWGDGSTYYESTGYKNGVYFVDARGCITYACREFYEEVKDGDMYADYMFHGTVPTEQRISLTQFMDKVSVLHQEIPPIGLRPRMEADRARSQEILEAMLRFVAVGQSVPHEWWKELGSILAVTVTKEGV